jgi:hypothetical protein
MREEMQKYVNKYWGERAFGRSGRPVAHG